MKKKLPDWFPKACHPEWQNCDAFSEDVLNKIKKNLRMPTSPLPDRIFEPFAINPETIDFILVGNKYPLTEAKDAKYKDFNPQLKEIWDVLRKEIWQDDPLLYLQPDLSCWENCLIINTSLTERQPEVWKEFMTLLFEYFGMSDKQYVFCFLDSTAFEYNKYVKKHEVFYKFQAVEIQQVLTDKFGHNFYWGLPFVWIILMNLNNFLI